MNTVRGQQINTWKMRITFAYFLAKQHPKDLVGKFDNLVGKFDNFQVALSRFAYLATFLFVAELEMFIACW